MLSALVLTASSCRHSQDAKTLNIQEQLAPQQTTILLVAPKSIEDFVAWLGTTVPQISKQLGVDPVKSVRVYVDTTPIVVYDDKPFAIYGYYDREKKEIKIWTRLLLDPITNYYTDISLEVLKGVFYHEYLHYYDHVTGAPAAPTDHNALFDERIKQLGWK